MFDISDWKDANDKNLVEGETFVMNETLAEEFNELSDDAKAVVYDVFKHGFEANKQKHKLLTSMVESMGDGGKNVFAELKKNSKVFEPYAPLTRSGIYNVVWRSNKLKAEKSRLEALINELTKITKANEGRSDKDKQSTETLERAIRFQREVVDKLESSGNNYVVSRFDNLWDAMDLQKELDARESGNKSTRSIVTENNRSLTSLANLNTIASSMEEAVKKEHGGMVAQSVIKVLDEALVDAAHKRIDSSMRRRRNIAGANPHMMETFMHHASTDAWLLANMEYGRKISDAITEVGSEVKKMERQPDKDPRRYAEANALHN